VDTLVFDKTGTLTRNRMRVCGIYPAAGWEENELLALAAGLEQHCDHPLAETVVHHAVSSGIEPPAAGDVAFLVSRGVSGTVDGKRALVGNRRFLSDMNGIDTRGVDKKASRLRSEGKIVLYVARNGKAAGLLALQDSLRPEARDVITELKKSGIRDIIVLTGDHEKPTRHLIGKLAGIDALHWELMPEDKTAIVKALKREGRRVAVVGDGINDAPALAAADIGICMGHGGDLARAAAQAVILTDDLRSLAVAREIALRQYAILDRCFSQGFFVNTGLLALALAGVLQPLAAALIHNLNTLSLIACSAIKGRSAVGSGRRIRSCDSREELQEASAGGSISL
jgi:Cu2+-exporting ATPase